MHRNQGPGLQCACCSLCNTCPFYGDQHALGCSLKTLPDSPNPKTLVSPSNWDSYQSPTATRIVSQQSLASSPACTSGSLPKTVPTTLHLLVVAVHDLFCQAVCKQKTSGLLEQTLGPNQVTLNSSHAAQD